MTQDHVVVTCNAFRRINRLAYLTKFARAYSLKDAPGREGNGSTRFGRYPVTTAGSVFIFDVRHRRKQHLRVRVLIFGEECFARTNLNQRSSIHHRYPVRQVTHHVEIMRDKKIADAALCLQLDK